MNTEVYKKLFDHLEEEHDLILLESERQEIVQKINEAPLLKTSQEWLDIQKAVENKDIFIMDPDGWDRKNFLDSWTEKITYQEYMFRFCQSTVMSRKKFKS